MPGGQLRIQEMNIKKSFWRIKVSKFTEKAFYTKNEIYCDVPEVSCSKYNFPNGTEEAVSCIEKQS